MPIFTLCVFCVLFGQAVLPTCPPQTTNGKRNVIGLLHPRALEPFRHFAADALAQRGIDEVAVIAVRE